MTNPNQRGRLYQRTAFHCLPKTEAGCRMPSSAAISVADAERRKAAESGSRALLNALLSYFANGGRG